MKTTQTILADIISEAIQIQTPETPTARSSCGRWRRLGIGLIDNLPSRMKPSTAPLSEISLAVGQGAYMDLEVPQDVKKIVLGFEAQENGHSVVTTALKSDGSH
jgi:hypothetical protein